ncbi:MAG TPA: tRNA lysidine(34) synthetase TilS [Coleofasciculaceae cyanobacterium]
MLSPWSDQHAKLHQTLRSGQLLPERARLLVATSGGQDSICLLRLLVDLRRLWGWSLVVGHCNHGWRSDAAANATFVADLAQSWDLPCVVTVWAEPRSGEAAARHWRYEALGAIAADHHCPIVVTGHTASDRAETLLHHLVRGSGSDGLSSLDWQRAAPWGTLVRPLLNWTRDETATFCHDRNLAIWHDSTNADNAYTRNRIRSQVLPLLREQLNPQADRHLAQAAELLADETRWLDTLTDQWLAAHPIANQRLDRQPLSQEPIALQRRVIRRWLAQCAGRSFTYDQVATVLDLLNAPHRSQTGSLPGGAIVQVDHHELRWIDRPSPA